MISEQINGNQANGSTVVEAIGVSRWFGDVVAVSDLSFAIGPGVTGLLGPNGSGKTTTLKMLSGLLAPSAGSVAIHGRSARGDNGVYRDIGLVADDEQVYPFLTGREFVRLNALMQGLPNVEAATDRVIATVEMREASERKIGGYSKGMRQRIKVAGALVHDPDVLLMDEPLNGTDPAQRAHLSELILQLGNAGKTILVSSHVLEEVERFAENILVIVNGKLAAEGNFRALRDLIDEHPRTIRIVASEPRLLAAALIDNPATTAVRIDQSGDIVAETGDARAFAIALPQLASAAGVRLLEVQPTDESLQSVFNYLVERK